MPSPREIKRQILNVNKIQKITSTMQKVAASKMQRAQRRMESSIFYAKKIAEFLANLIQENTNYTHPYLEPRESIRKVGYIVVATDRGLCGGLNLKLLRMVWMHAEQLQSQNIQVSWCLFGTKAWNFFQKIPNAKVVGHTVNLGENPLLSNLIGNTKVMLDAYKQREVDQLFIAHNSFISKIEQEPVIVPLLPLQFSYGSSVPRPDYIFEPNLANLLDILLTRYIETQVYQATTSNLACEQVARMLAMQNATNNTKDLIHSLQLLYNKSRQAAITQEIADLVAGGNH